MHKTSTAARTTEFSDVAYEVSNGEASNGYEVYAYLLDSFRLQTRDGQPVVVHGAKACALIAYLVLNAGHKVSRQKIAGLLWGDVSEEKARTSLRQAVSQIRKCFDPINKEILLVDRLSIGLDINKVWSDVTTLKQQVFTSDWQALAQADITLNKPLLHGLDTKAEDFNDWLHVARVSFADELIKRLYSQQQLAIAHDDKFAAINIAKKILQLDCCDNAANTLIIETLLTLGDKVGAVQHYERFANILQQQLDIQPEPQLSAQVLHIKQATPVNVPLVQSENKCLQPIADIGNERSVLLQGVKQYWLEDVLQQSLHNNLLLKCGLEKHLCCQLTLRQRASLLEHEIAGDNILDVFNGLNQAMLILGEPGAGKTTLLLELAKQLYDKAQQDKQQLAPLVLHLSSWAIVEQDLATWILSELDQRYDIPPLWAQRLLEQGVIVLLDGLDEVAASKRDACVAAINHFRQTHSHLPIAVCSRIADYAALTTALELTAAVAIKPLQQQQIAQYLENAGESVAGLHKVLSLDKGLWPILTTPLMLSIAILAYQYGVVDEPAYRCSAEDRRQHLFYRYTEAMFARRQVKQSFTKSRTQKSLAWLAKTLLRQNQTVLYLEWMQPEFLQSLTQQKIVSTGSVVLIGLMVGCLVMIFGSGYVGWLLSGAVGIGFGFFGGLVAGLLGYGDEVRPVTRLRLNWSRLKAGCLKKLSKSIFVGSLLGIGIALVVNVNTGFLIGLLMALSFIAFEALDFDLIAQDKQTQRQPNQGVWRSMQNAMKGLIFGAVSGGVLGWSIAGTEAALFGAGLLGIVTGMFIGGHYCLQYYLLRFFMSINGYMPWRLIAFLNHGVERAFLHKVGGGYMFIHRSLLEHFATYD